MVPETGRSFCGLEFVYRPADLIEPQALVPCQVCKEGWLGSNDSEPPAAGGSASLRPQPPNPSLKP